MSSTNQNNCTNGVEEDADDDINRALVLSGLRSSSPSRPPNDGFAETNREEGIITRSASKRKGIYEQLSVFKGTSHFKQGNPSFNVAGDFDQEPPLYQKGGKRARHYSAGKQHARSRTVGKGTSSPDNSAESREKYYGPLPDPPSDPPSSDPFTADNDESDPICNQRSKARAKKTARQQFQTAFLKLGADDLERVTYYLDTKSAINLLCACKEINQKLTGCSGFWHQLCKNENFHEYSALKLEEHRATLNTNPNLDDKAIVDENIPSEEKIDIASSDVNTPCDNKICIKAQTLKEKSSGRIKDVSRKIKSERLCWSGEKFHDVYLPPNATFWRKIFLRGIQMRRNICDGRFELWRLFLTDENHMPVKRMTLNTTFRELRSEHRGSNFNRPERRVRIHRYWNEDYFIAIQQSTGGIGSFHDVFVWSWEECQKPRFLYSHSLHKEYPTGLFPTAFFLWQSYLVLMPDTRHSGESQALRSVIRVHDLSNKRMQLVGSYDFPEDSPTRRHVQGIQANGLTGGNETAHLHKLGDFAVALCRTPDHTILIFSLPECRLVHHTKLNVTGSIERPLEEDELDQRFLMRNNTMMFMFHHAQFFYDDEHVIIHPHENQPNRRRYGRLLFVDFTRFLATQTNKPSSYNVQEAKIIKNNHTSDLICDSNNPLISMCMDSLFDCNDDYIEKISVISKERMACVMSSGKIILRDVLPPTVHNPTACSHRDKLSIPCPQGLKLHDGGSDDSMLIDDNEGEDIDGPTLCTSRDGDMVMVMRHFKTGRKIHAYDTNNEGRLLYEINMDADPRLRLTPTPGYVSVDMDGNFVCAADLEKIVIWNSRNGKLIKVIPIAPHYSSRDDPHELLDRYCWKGHTDFAFAEDGIIIVHSQRNFPVAADVILFW